MKVWAFGGGSGLGSLEVGGLGVVPFVTFVPSSPHKKEKRFPKDSWTIYRGLPPDALGLSAQTSKHPISGETWIVTFSAFTPDGNDATKSVSFVFTLTVKPASASPVTA